MHPRTGGDSESCGSIRPQGRGVSCGAARAGPEHHRRLARCRAADGVAEATHFERERLEKMLPKHVSTRYCTYMHTYSRVTVSEPRGCAGCILARRRGTIPGGGTRRARPRPRRLAARSWRRGAQAMRAPRRPRPPRLQAKAVRERRVHIRCMRGGARFMQRRVRGGCAVARAALARRSLGLR